MNLVKRDPFRVPDDADEAPVKAEFKDGIFDIALPGSAKAKPESIDVSFS